MDNEAVFAPTSLFHLIRNLFMELYDVIIVGAGPAGLKCAEVLGGSALRVLLLEKNEKIGPKICAGGLTGKDIAYLNLPQELVEFRRNKIKLHVKGFKSTVKTDYDFAFSIDREELGQWQLKKLAAFGNVAVRTNARVSAIANQRITVNGETIAYKYLVGADGSNSIVKRFLGFKTPARGIGIQYIIPTDKYRDFEFFFTPKYFSAWYSWIFPHKGYVSIGCGCTPGILPLKKLHRNFHSWLEKNKIDVSEGKYEVFPMNYDYHGTRFGDIFLAGDAAGLLSVFTGEGIYQALVSGEEVAKAILDPNTNREKCQESSINTAGINNLPICSSVGGNGNGYYFFAGCSFLKYRSTGKKPSLYLDNNLRHKPTRHFTPFSPSPKKQKRGPHNKIPRKYYVYGIFCCTDNAYLCNRQTTIKITEMKVIANTKIFSSDYPSKRSYHSLTSLRMRCRRRK